MNGGSCCGVKTRLNQAGRTRSFWSGGGEIAGWVVPTATLALLPKCPACVAGYLALATGIGISLPTAAYVRATLIGVCVASLIFLTARRLRGLCRRGCEQPGSPAGGGDVLE